MGKVILCEGKKAVRPYTFKTSGVNVYTIEELCYCLHSQLDMLDESSIDRDMAIFMYEELGLEERGRLLEQLVLTKADLKSRLVVIFCSCDYFSEDEIKQICREVDELQQMSSSGRRKLKADRYMCEDMFKEALHEYEDIMASKGFGELTDTEYAGVLHNLGVIHVRLGHFDTAADYFRDAYERGGSEESLKSYFFALKIGGNEKAYISEAMRLVDNGAFIRQLEHEYEEAENASELAPGMDQIDKLKVLYQQGRAFEFDRLSKEMIEALKRKYRGT